MPVDGKSREYTWEDIVGLILRDMGLPVDDKDHFDMWYLGAFQPPVHQDVCIRMVVYELTHNERLEERTKGKI